MRVVGLTLVLALAVCLVLETPVTGLDGPATTLHAGGPSHSGLSLATQVPLGTFDAVPAGVAPPRLGNMVNHPEAIPLNETTLKWFNAPFSVVFDPVNGYVYISDSGSENVSVVDPSTNRIIAYVPLGGIFAGNGNLVCDPITGNVYAGGGSQITVIGAKTNTAISTIPIANPSGALPDPLTYDAQTGDVFVLDQVGTNISVVNRTSILATVSLPWQYASGAVYDSTNQEVYATSFSFSYPPCSGSCYVNKDNVSLINGSTFAVTPNVFTMLPASQLIYVPAYREIFSAGLRGNVSVFDPETGKTTAVLNLSAGLGGLAYDSRNGLIYSTDRFFGDPYDGRTITSGDNVTIVDPRTDRSVGSIPVWSQPVGIAYDDRTNELFVANMDSGSVSVINLTATYHLDFTETGLPIGTLWNISASGVSHAGTGPNIGFVEPNGTYNFSVSPSHGYVPQLEQGAVTVNGYDVGVMVRFVPPSSLVRFEESGLPARIEWSTQLGGQLHESTISSISFNESNGTYDYTVPEIAGFRANPSAGNVSVLGLSVVQEIIFSGVTSASTPSLLGIHLVEGAFIVGSILFSVLILAGVLLPRAIRRRHRSTRDDQHAGTPRHPASGSPALELAAPSSTNLSTTDGPLEEEV